MSEDHQFNFIYFVKNESECSKSSKSLDSLKVPSGFKISKMVLNGDFSIIEGYNFVLRNSTAKYKIYLHQDLKIINPNFLDNILSLFTKYSDLGMLGVIGALELPVNGNWWEATKRYGKIIFAGKLISHPFASVDDYQPVQAIDGKIIITQYDLPWRADLFKKPYFYDTAQCLEFIKAGYKVGVPCQNEPWCAYEYKNDALFLYHQDRELFINEYQQFVT